MEDHKPRSNEEADIRPLLPAAKSYGSIAVVDSGARTARLVSLDQFRGFTMVAMLVVNFIGGFDCVPAALKHGYGRAPGGLGAPDFVMPFFLFCVGCALQLTMSKRIARKGGRCAAFADLLSSRFVGLIMLQVFTDKNFDSFSTWNSVVADGAGGWLLRVLRSPYNYGTLLQIAFTSAWTFWAFAHQSVWARLALLAVSLALHVAAFAAFYWRWIITYGLDEGGYLGFLGWTLAFTLGSFAHDVVTGGAIGAGHPWRCRGRAPPRTALVAGLVATGAALMTTGYALTFIVVAPCFTNVYAGSAETACGVGGAPPFPLLPPPSPAVASATTMSLRSASLPFHAFTQGAALIVYAGFFAACDIGCARPAGGGCWRRRSSDGAPADATPPRWTLRLWVLDLFGDNALAVYVMHTAVGDTVRDLLPSDSPAWYAIAFGLSLYLGVMGVFAAYLRRHNLYLRL